MSGPPWSVGWCTGTEQEPDPRLEVGRGPFECAVRRPGARTCRSRIGNAPVRALGVRGELGTHLAHAVTERDHHVELAGAELVEVLGPLSADVDAAGAHDADGVRMQRLRVA